LVCTGQHADPTKSYLGIWYSTSHKDFRSLPGADLSNYENYNAFCSLEYFQIIAGELQKRPPLGGLSFDDYPISAD
jgi:hypothetical protein